MTNQLKKILPHFVVFLVFILTSLIYFSPVLQGKKIFQSDIVQYIGMSKERNDFKDKTGEESYWTNSAFGGMPTYQLGANYPHNYIKKLDKTIRFLPRPADYLFLYFIGFYILLLVLKVDWKLAGIGALAFGFSTYLIIILGVGHNAKAHAIGYFPFVLAGILLAFKKRYIAGFLVTAFAMALEINANHFQMTYYLMLLVLVFGIVYLIDAFKKKELPHFFKTVGILANKSATARELLSRIQVAYQYLPRFLQQGVLEWNKGSLEIENGSKILASSTSSSAIRGFSFSAVLLDEFAFVQRNIADEFIRISDELLDSSRHKKLVSRKLLRSKVEELTRKLKSTELTKAAAEKDAKKLSGSVLELTSHLLNAQEEFENLLKKYNSDKAFNNRIIKERDLLQRKVDSLQSEIVRLKKENSRNKNYALWLLTALQSAHQKLWKRSFRFRKEAKVKANKIKASECFDAIYYGTHNSDVSASKMLPEIHYVLYGAYEGRNPSLKFNTINYISKYHDVAGWGGIPLIHYIEYGAAENRDMS